MQKIHTFTSRVLSYWVALGMFTFTACSSPRISQINATHSTPAAFSAVAEAQAASTSKSSGNSFETSSEATYASTTSDEASISAVKTAVSTSKHAAEAQKIIQAAASKSNSTVSQSTKKGLHHKMAEASAKLILKKALKKAEKRKDSKDIKDAQASKALENSMKVGIILAIVGLILSLLNLGALSVIGFLALIVGLVIILLSLLEVI